jgi:outer membrane immunogenic protein
MKAMYRLPLIAASQLFAFGAAQSASSADLEFPPQLPPVSHYTWTGFYLGVNGGAGRGNETFSGSQAISLGSTSFSGGLNSAGGLAGGQIGFNYEFPEHAILGLEADVDWAHLTGSTAGCATFTGGLLNGFPAGCTTTNFALNGFETLRARVGYAWNDVILLYGTGGWAWTNSSLKASTSCFGPACPSATIPFIGGTASVSNTFSGWVAGAGVEWGFSQSWTARVEYLHLEVENIQANYTTNTSTLIGPIAATTSMTSTRGTDVVRVGVNYLFKLGD